MHGRFSVVKWMSIKRAHHRSFISLRPAIFLSFFLSFFLDDHSSSSIKAKISSGIGSNFREEMANNSIFKKKYSFEERCGFSSWYLKNSPGQFPVIIEKAVGSDLPDMRNKRMGVPGGFTARHFEITVREFCHISADVKIFIFVGNQLLPAGVTVSDVYRAKKDKDGFLYITYSSEENKILQ